MSSRENTVPFPSATRGEEATKAPLTSTYLRRRSRSEPAVFVSVMRVLQNGLEPSSRGAPPAWTAGNESVGGKPPIGRLESVCRDAEPDVTPVLSAGNG